jgi:hypothetical protein
MSFSLFNVRKLSAISFLILTNFIYNGSQLYVVRAKHEEGRVQSKITTRPTILPSLESTATGRK